MTIHVIGTCQAIAVGQCVAVMNPAVRVRTYVTRGDPPLDLVPGDVVFRQRNRYTAWEAGERPGEILYPRVWYNALHPDCVYVAGPAGPVPPPLGYHSSLVLYAWARGLDAAATARLFCEPVFEHLGFFAYRDAARAAVLEEGRGCAFPLDELLAGWERRGRFVYTPNHPALFVTADIARVLLRRAGIEPAFDAPEDLLPDEMLDKAVWPVYPEIARRFGIPGSYAFKPAQPPGSAEPPAVLDLDAFIARSFAAYEHMPPSALASARLSSPAYRDLESLAARSAPPAERRPRGESPYADLPPSRFWRRAVERVPARDVDPVGTPPFAVDRTTRIATAGSCFAQTMSRVLARHGYRHLVAEPAPEGMSAAAARAAGYGVFSTRCGNVYTARQLRQLLERAYGVFTPREDVWLRPDGRYADPFRPQIEPDGFATAADVRAERERHLAAVRAMFESLDVLIFTLGLTEAWRAKEDGAVFPLAPGVVAGEADLARYEFVNFTTAEVRDDLGAFLAALLRVNARAKVVLTVSPQPPIATYEPRHVLVSAAYTKAALRAAADEVERAHPQVWYFPGYELVAGPHSRGAYYEPDLRTVTPAGIEHVMRLFFAHAAADGPVADKSGARAPDARLLSENEANMDVVCDEEAIAFGAAPAPAPPDATRDVWSVEHEQYLDRADPRFVWDEAAVPLAEGTMEALAPASMRASLEADLPSAMTAGAVVNLRVTVTNGGDVTLITGGAFPVYLCYRWYDERGEPAEVGASIHTRLPAPLEPGVSARIAMPVAAPRYPGRYRLAVTLLQSQVAWFDDVDPRSGVASHVDVVAHEIAQPAPNRADMPPPRVVRSAR
jgi:GSCFA family/Polysaccharide biosynthesis enzyme WcbI